MATVNTAWDQKSSNIFKTWVIMFLFTLFTIVVVYVIARGFGFGEIGGVGIVGMALIAAGIMNLVSYYYSDKIVLGIAGAKELKHDTNKEIYHLVENLCIASGLPTPKIYIINDTILSKVSSFKTRSKGVKVAGSNKHRRRTTLRE